MLAQQPIRWSQLLRIVDHHKVAPLVFRNLETFAAGYMPDELAAALAATTVENAETCRRRCGQLATIHRLFHEQQIDFRIFKGIPLALTAFQDFTLRDAGDIDLLVAERDMFAAGEILRSEGYVRFEPQARLTQRRLQSYIAHQKDFSYVHPLAGVVIDLHWRFFRNPWLPANARLEQVGEDWVDIGSENIPTLPAPQLLLYLCVHGALDGWLRLKWLADIGALLNSMTAAQLASTAAAASEQQALPQFSAAIFLCQDLLGSYSMPPGCLDRNDSRVARILRFSKCCMTSNQYCPVRERIPSTQWFLNEFRLHRAPQYRRNLLHRSLFRPRVWHKYNLPDTLFPLYALLSPFEWLSFHFRPRLAMLKQAWPMRTRRSPWTPIPFRRLWQHGPRDIALAIEAGCMLSFFRLALNFLPVQRLTAWMGSPKKKPSSISQERSTQTLRRIEWSIDAVNRHVPLTFVCFPQSLAAYFMLRRRNIASRLYYGVMREADQLKAHTWVKVGERTVVGGEVEPHFTVLATFP